jgi:hypothetical protein
MSITAVAATCANASNSTAIEGMANRVYLRGAGLPTNFDIQATPTTNVITFGLPAPNSAVGLSVGAEWADLGTAAWTEAWPLNGAKVITNDHGVGEYEVAAITIGSGDIFSGSITFPSISVSPGLKTGTESATNLPIQGDQIVLTSSAQVGGVSVSSSYQIIDIDAGARTLHLTPPLDEPLPINGDDIYTSNRGMPTLHIVQQHDDGGAGDLYVPLFSSTGAGQTNAAATRFNLLDDTLSDMEAEIFSGGDRNDGDTTLKLSTLVASTSEPKVGDVMMVSGYWNEEYTILAKDETLNTIDITPGISGTMPWVGSGIGTDAVGSTVGGDTISGSFISGNNAPDKRCKPDLIIKEVINDPVLTNVVKLVFTTPVWVEVAGDAAAIVANPPLGFTSDSATTTGTQPQCLAEAGRTTGTMERFKSSYGRIPKYSGGAGRWGVSSTNTNDNTVTISPILEFRDESSHPANFWFDSPAAQHLILDGDQLITFPAGVNTFICDPPGFKIGCMQNDEWKKSAPKHGHSWDGTTVVP